MSKKKDKVDPGSPFAKLAELKKKMIAEDEQAGAKPNAKRAPLPMARSAPKPGGASSDADESLEFHRLMSGVVPLDQAHARVPRTEPTGASGTAARLAEGRARDEREREAAQVRLRELALGGSRFEVTDDGQRVEGRRDDVPPDVMRKLRRGMLPIDARLDMHGMRAEEARNALVGFLRENRARGERCVLVIHGRGEHSAGPAVLRGEIAAWLSQGAASEHVAGFASAHEGDGGVGATYVLLRR